MENPSCKKHLGKKIYHLSWKTIHQQQTKKETKINVHFTNTLIAPPRLP